MLPMIKFCVSNLANGSQRARQILERDPNLSVMEYGCLRHCNLCPLSPYALVNGKYVAAETPEELVEKIYQYLEENFMF